MQKWEYLTVDTQNSISTTFTVVAGASETVDGMDITEYLDTLGQHGWELVCCHPLEAALFGVGQRFFFKRPTQ